MATAKRVARYYYTQIIVVIAFEATKSDYRVCAQLFAAEDWNLEMELLTLK